MMGSYVMEGRCSRGGASNPALRCYRTERSKKRVEYGEAKPGNPECKESRKENV